MPAPRRGASLTPGSTERALGVLEAARLGAGDRARPEGLGQADLTLATARRQPA